MNITFYECGSTIKQNPLEFLTQLEETVHMDVSIKALFEYPRRMLVLVSITASQPYATIICNHNEYEILKCVIANTNY